MRQTSDKELARELALVRVEATGTEQDRALDVVGRWSARLLKLDAENFTVEWVGDPQKLDDFLIEIMRFGEISLSRSGALTVN
jgi:acetolactate synthase small subunit